ncbi:DUF2797 domain-containing protein [Streptomyces sp. NPDC060194]|uniref:DUF2797 domain-containing protein n=1 Tax=Streptomyces sp. NPDC060194 TaxID=3347069 RepID=UPI003661394E
MTEGWRCDGVRWEGGGPGVGWGGGKVSALRRGAWVGFVARGVRRCTGARGNACPVRAEIGGRITGARCEECARLDRMHSVAADTLADDPRPYAVYLAWFGPGLVKVGITRADRGSARLLEQGAVAFTWVGRGPLMAARRAEETARAGLGIPDRVPYERKRLVRGRLPAAGERRFEVEELYGRVVGLAGWPEALEAAPCAVVDHGEVFGVDEVPVATGVVSELVTDGRVGGELLAVAGPDLHLRVEGGGVLVVDTRLLRGWRLGPAREPGVTVPVRAVGGEQRPQEGLF